MEGLHTPVLSMQVLDAMAPRDGGAYIDCTLGNGGHAARIAQACAPTGRLLGLDADAEAIDVAASTLAPYGERIRMVNANFRDLGSVAHAEGFVPADSVLFDLGVSSRQLDVARRGFSFRHSEPLDMRFGQDGGPTAEEMVNTLDEGALADLLYQYGEEPRSRRIARAIVQARPITDTARLAETVARASGYRRGRTHPATRTFQALRIAVNDELGALRAGLARAVEILVEGGRLVTIAYHSLEDRIVKVFVRNDARLEPLTKRVVKPEPSEIAANRRSRSARLRTAQKIASEEARAA